MNDLDRFCERETPSKYIRIGRKTIGNTSTTTIIQVQSWDQCRFRCSAREHRSNYFMSWFIERPVCWFRSFFRSRHTLHWFQPSLPRTDRSKSSIKWPSLWMNIFYRSRPTYQHVFLSWMSNQHTTRLETHRSEFFSKDKMIVLIRSREITNNR